MASLIFSRKRVLSKFDLLQSHTRVNSNNSVAPGHNKNELSPENNSSFPLTQIESQHRSKKLLGSKSDFNLNSKIRTTTNHMSVTKVSNSQFGPPCFFPREDFSDLINSPRKTLSKPLPPIMNYEQAILMKNNQKNAQQQHQQKQQQEQSVSFLGSIGNTSRRDSKANNNASLESSTTRLISPLFRAGQENKRKKLLLQEKTALFQPRKESSTKPLRPYLEKLEYDSQKRQQDKETIDSFFMRMDTQRKKEEEQALKKVLQNKPQQVLEKKIHQTKLLMSSEDTLKLERLLRSLKVVVDFVDSLRADDFNEGKHARLLKRLLLRGKGLDNVFLNEHGDGFSTPFTAEDLGNKFIVSEKVNIGADKQLEIVERYDFTLLEEIEQLEIRIGEYKQSQREKEIHRLQQAIIQEETLVLDVASHMEQQHYKGQPQNQNEQTINGWIQAYQSVASVSSESPTMNKNGSLTKDMKQVAKNDYSIANLMNKDNLRSYDQLSNSISALHSFSLKARKNIFYFK